MENLACLQERQDFLDFPLEASELLCIVAHDYDWCRGPPFQLGFIHILVMDAIAFIIIAAIVVLMLSAPSGSAIKLLSSAFSDGGKIPTKYTCDGDDVSPPLSIENASQGAKSLALIVDDPDAPGGVFVHGVIWNISPANSLPENAIPANTTSIPENVPSTEVVELLDRAKQGVNDFGKLGYRGPCPPSGPPHRYIFKLYALDTTLGLGAGASKAELEDAMRGHILAETTLTGKYGR